jgi:type VI secretion system protein ImpA
VARGARFPHSLTEQPLVKAGAQSFSYLDSLRPERKAEFEEAIPKADPDGLRRTYEDLVEAREALKGLAKVLDEKMGADVAPDFLSPETTGNLGNAIGSCINLVEEVAKRRGVPLTDTPAESQSAVSGEQTTTQTAASGPAGIAGTREGLYRQLGQLAAALKQIEPHSPIPFLLDRCVRLGALPFPELMRAIIHENATLDALDRLIGLEKKE